MEEGAGKLWWYLAVLVLVWIGFMFFFPTGSPKAELAYSAFRAQVEAGNVTQVTLQGHKAEGDFAQPVTVTQDGKRAPYRQFVTQLPPIDDPRLLPMLEAKGVQVAAKPEASRWWLDLLLVAAPILLLFVILGRMGAGGAGQQTAFTFGQSKAKLYTTERPKVTFADVAGEDEAKKELVEVVQFLKEPAKFRKLGAKIPKGVLLVGPPGTGKTLLARAVAGEAGVPFFSISGTEFVEMFVGVGASRVRDLFEKAKSRAPAIIFMDEIDSVGRRRGVGIGNVNDEREQTLNQLLAEMDGFDPHQEVIVIAATNRPDVLDPALLRPGRFDRRVVVGLPDRAGREAILGIHAAKVPLSPDVKLLEIAWETPGFSGADLANLVNEAALAAATKGEQTVSAADFEEAKDKIIMGVRRNTMLDPKERRLVACHEAGHALVAHLLPNADPLHKVTIVPHGHALGVTQMLPQDEKYSFPRAYLLDKMTVQLGGRAAEELVFGEVTTGAENDLLEMTKLARRMVLRWGMGTGLGPQAYDLEADNAYLGLEAPVGEKPYSEATASMIDQEVRRLTTEAYDRAKALLASNRDKLDRLAETLLAEEVLDAHQIETLVGAKVGPA
ncbi:ATP-dependent zinc metalloprotease FtsH [bacterium]|nr:ATP-dependent zinc metalloprotease FtsH [bacterium]